MFRRMVRRLFWGNADIGVMKPRRERLPEAVWEFLHSLPKAEIHLHFEGATDAGTIFHLAQTHGDPDIRTLADAQWALYFREPQQFFQQFLRVSNLFRSLDDFHIAAASLGKRFVEQNIQYAELTFAPHKFMEIDCGVSRHSLTGSEYDWLDACLDLVYSVNRNKVIRRNGMAERFTVIVEQGVDGFLISEVVGLPGCHTQAKTHDELMARTKEAIALYLQDNDSSERSQFVGLQEVEVEF